MPMLTAAERLAAMASTLDSSAMLPSSQVTGGGAPGATHSHVWGEAPTGTVAARLFVVQFVSDGTNLYEVSRTAALVA